jgi:hypothetical protein
MPDEQEGHHVDSGPHLEPASTHRTQPMDLFRLIKTSENGKKFILCITDAFTKCV